MGNPNSEICSQATDANARFDNVFAEARCELNAIRPAADGPVAWRRDIVQSSEWHLTARHASLLSTCNLLMTGLSCVLMPEYEYSHTVMYCACRVGKISGPPTEGVRCMKPCRRTGEWLCLARLGGSPSRRRTTVGGCGKMVRLPTLAGLEALKRGVHSVSDPTRAREAGSRGHDKVVSARPRFLAVDILQLSSSRQHRLWDPIPAGYAYAAWAAFQSVATVRETGIEKNMTRFCT